MKDWKEAKGRWSRLPQAVGRAPAGCRWTAPTVNSWKCNTDVAAGNSNSTLASREVLSWLKGGGVNNVVVEGTRQF
ncbi:hypothetical protein GOBAR_DD34813 [Gossypium barbadense]|nr:hypothetical protein GOBAR_DD34813 [Gossypium barbadense]